MIIKVGERYVTNGGDVAVCTELKPNERYVFKISTLSSGYMTFDTDKDGKRYGMPYSPLNIKCPYDTKYKTEVMEAFEKGSKIEIFNPTNGWTVVDNPFWDWEHCKYRVEHTRKKIPLIAANLDERIEKNKTMWVRKDNGTRRLIIRYNDIGVTFGSLCQNPLTLTYKEFMESGCVFLNGDPTYRQSNFLIDLK